MSKVKLAVLLFVVAFGVNLLAFLFSKKTFTIEEVKNVWLYELPQTASPLDGYVSVDLGPQHGIIGTLIRPDFAKALGSPEGLLAREWTWDERQKMLTVTLRDGLTYSDGSPILNSHFVESAMWAISTMKDLGQTPEWTAWLQAKVSAPEAQKLVFHWDDLPKGFLLNRFLGDVLSQPLTGVFHPDNLKKMKAGESITKEWISSGPYQVRKWKAKEIFLVSRDHFPVMLPAPFFREVRYQSAPVKNPSCHFLQSAEGKDVTEKELTVNPMREELHVFWLCRSWRQEGRFCADGSRREKFEKLMNGESLPVTALTGTVVKYRIPVGSDDFRTKIRENIEARVKTAGGTAEEISFFFKNSVDADIELEFVNTPTGEFGGPSSSLAQVLARNSTRLGLQAPENTVGEIGTYPMNILMKHDHGPIFQKAFLEPDLAEKKLLF